MDNCPGEAETLTQLPVETGPGGYGGPERQRYHHRNFFISKPNAPNKGKQPNLDHRPVSSDVVCELDIQRLPQMYQCRKQIHSQSSDVDDCINRKLGRRQSCSYAELDMKPLPITLLPWPSIKSPVWAYHTKSRLESVPVLTPNNSAGLEYAQKSRSSSAAIRQGQPSLTILH